MNIVPVLMFSALVSMQVGVLPTPHEQQSKPVLLTTLQQVMHEDQIDVEPVDIVQPPESYYLPATKFVSQSYNNCGPAAMSMVFASYNLDISQEELASKMRPYNFPYGGDDDKSVFPTEFVTTAKSYGFESIYRPNGDIETLKKLIANDIPVVVRTWLNPGEDVGHYRIIKGYDDAAQTFTQDDSYQGQGLTYSYQQVEEMWKPFNYSYILVYPKEKEATVSAILGENMDEKVAYQNALKRANEDLEKDSNDFYAEFNKSTAYYHLGDSKNSVESYDKIKDQLPDRILWYVYEPLYAYMQEGKYDRILTIAEGILNNGNKAYSELYQLRGEIYLNEGNKEAARSEFEQAVYYNSNFEPAKKALETL